MFTYRPFPSKNIFRWKAPSLSVQKNLPTQNYHPIPSRFVSPLEMTVPSRQGGCFHQPNTWCMSAALPVKTPVCLLVVIRSTYSPSIPVTDRAIKLQPAPHTTIPTHHHHANPAQLKPNTYQVHPPVHHKIRIICRQHIARTEAVRTPEKTFGATAFEPPSSWSLQLPTHQNRWARRSVRAAHLQRQTKA